MRSMSRYDGFVPLVVGGCSHVRLLGGRGLWDEGLVVSVDRGTVSSNVLYPVRSFRTCRVDIVVIPTKVLSTGTGRLSGCSVLLHLPLHGDDDDVRESGLFSTVFGPKDVFGLTMFFRNFSVSWEQYPTSDV